MQMAGLENYETGGSIHVICNNQVGFTTDPEHGRSTKYASDLGKAFEAPIFHVNGDDTEEVVRVFEIAAQWRQAFSTDVVIDVIGYRRHGHNEIDQPLFTQPQVRLLRFFSFLSCSLILFIYFRFAHFACSSSFIFFFFFFSLRLQMYAHIAKHGTPLAIYKAHLLSSGGLDATEVEGVIAAEQSKIEAAFAASEEYAVPADNWMADNAGACGLLSFVFCCCCCLFGLHVCVWFACARVSIN